jgi:hypothetical protein
MNRKTQAGILMILIVAAVATLFLVILPTTAQQFPDQVVQDFYAWYIGYAETANPLVDKAYRSSEALSQDFIARMDEFTSRPMMFDPILCAQDVPASISTAKPAVARSTATVHVETSFAGHAFDVELAKDGNTWKITDVVCSAP